jgi:serum/glucocorticoid-regulated kinase 2
LDSFEVIKMIGSGGFSKVFLCRLKKDGQFYAMKVIDKEVIVKNRKKNIIMNERNIMKDTTHPFLIEMKFAFETEKFLVFIVEYCPGGELFGLIKRYRRLT